MASRVRSYMQENAKTGEAAKRCDDIAELARVYLCEPGMRGLQKIDDQIDRAKREARWDEMSKWHRVRFRLMRMQQERAINAKLEPLCDTSRRA